MNKKTIIINIFILNFLLLNNLCAYWEKINNGLINIRYGRDSIISIVDLLVYNNTLYVTTRYAGVHISTNNGENWVRKNNGIEGDIIPLTLLAHNTNTIFALVKKLFRTYLDTLTGKYVSDSSGVSGIYYSKDGGENWYPVKRKGLADSNYISAFAANDSILIVGTDNKQGVYISTDNGDNWVQKKNGLNTRSISSIVINDNLIFLGTSGGVYLSSDGGENWLNKSPDFISQIHFKGDTLISCSWYSGVNISYDKGETWVNKNNGLRETSVTCVTSINDLIFIGISPNVVRDPEGGVHYSSDGGDSWHTRNKGFRQTGINKLVIKDDYIFAAQSYGISDTNFGMYRAKLSDLINTTNVEYENKIKAHFDSSPPEPNPASDLVRVSIYWDAPVYDIEYTEKGIYNIMGNEISSGSELQVTNIQPYSADILWNCSKVSPGLYFIVLDYNGQTRTIPVLVTR